MATLIVDNGSCISNSGFAGSVLTLLSSSLVVRPKLLDTMDGVDKIYSICARRRPWQWLMLGWFCWYCTSRCVPFRCRQAQDAPHHGRYDSEGQFFAGFAGFAPRAVFLPVVYRPTMLGIMAVLDQMDSNAATLWQWHVQGSFCWYFHLAISSSRGFLAQMPCRQARRELGIMAGINQKDFFAVIVDNGSCMFKAGFTGYDTPRACSRWFAGRPLMFDIMAGIRGPDSENCLEVCSCCSSKVVDNPVFTRKLIPMVLFVQRTIEIFQFVDCG